MRLSAQGGKGEDGCDEAKKRGRWRQARWRRGEGKIAVEKERRGRGEDAGGYGGVGDGEGGGERDVPTTSPEETDAAVGRCRGRCATAVRRLGFHGSSRLVSSHVRAGLCGDSLIWFDRTGSSEPEPVRFESGGRLSRPAPVLRHAPKRRRRGPPIGRSGSVSSR
ncbi:hypothetical protein BHE74_00044625 [Ensete ventricosum]|nr:hypothetical protein BHE74_00044625 [Ensete ventricosum]